ncbi:MAG TPA: choline kinase family protein [Solirubrobacteraceae bacterium]|nr:choline kinase family protein [Solirubrobacteraceae bacterium]
MPELAAIIARLEPELGPLEGDPQPLDGGITNRNYRLRLGGEDLVLRICDHGAEVLGIDRTTEEIASRRAAAEQIAPAVVAFLADVPALVTRWLPGGGLTPEQVRSPGVMAQLAGLLRRLHATPALPSAFAVFRLIEDQRGLAAAVPSSYEHVLTLARRIEGALTGPEHVPVSCHNDLLTANFVRDGSRVCIVDWEYAGMNNRYFDLGNLSVNNGFEAEHDRALLELYFGEPATEPRIAALQLMRVVSDFREAMWGAVQERRSALDFDYAGYAAEHFGRLEQAAADPRVEEWLAVAATA